MRMNLDHVASGHFVLGRDVNAVILSFDPNEEQSVICEITMKRMRAVESDSVKSARKVKDKSHKACERASETRERTMHGQEQNRIHMASIVGCNPTFRFSPDLPFFVKVGLHPTMASMRESRDSD